MCRSRERYFIALSALLFFSSLARLPGDVYLITGSEITQIRDECATLRLELSILKVNSEKDKASLRKLSQSLESVEQSLTNTQNELTSAQELLAEARTQLDELKASLTKSKRAELWGKIKVGGICLLSGASIGVIVGLALGNR